MSDTQGELTESRSAMLAAASATDVCIDGGHDYLLGRYEQVVFLDIGDSGFMDTRAGPPTTWLLYRA